jgi:hypothetical protein
LLLALLAPVLAVATAAAVSTSAQAHYRPRYACVIVKYDTWLRGCGHCWQPVYEGRAFRVLRPSGGRVLVRNRDMEGWMYHRELRLADERYCWAAGI